MGSDLTTVILPGCKHRFHELCIQQWLSPIQLRPTTSEPTRFWSAVVDTVFCQLEDRAILLEILERSLPDFLSTRREPVARIATGDEIDSEVEEALREAYAEDEMTEESEPEMSEDELEEGEIREVQPSQTSRFLEDLPPMSENFVYDRLPFTPRATSCSCPCCREPVFFGGPVVCHADTLQLIQVRLRLTDLAYRCLQFIPTEQERQDREIVKRFLSRRHADNVAMGEREIPLTPESCQRVFKQARLMLRNHAFMYVMEHELIDVELTNSTRFGAFFENFHLQEEHIAFFFDPNPAFNECLEDFEGTNPQINVFDTDIRRFFAELRLDPGIPPHSYTPLGAE
ncbi:MAG: hypothetical protein Q9166_000583 [cf. Caloplaca sp. 2 TL-2023]